MLSQQFKRLKSSLNEFKIARPGFEPRALGYEPNELARLLHPAMIIKGKVRNRTCNNGTQLLAKHYDTISPHCRDNKCKWKDLNLLHPEFSNFSHLRNKVAVNFSLPSPSPRLFQRLTESGLPSTLVLFCIHSSKELKQPCARALSVRILQRQVSNPSIRLIYAVEFYCFNDYNKYIARIWRPS